MSNNQGNDGNYPSAAGSPFDGGRGNDANALRLLGDLMDSAGRTDPSLPKRELTTASMTAVVSASSTLLYKPFGACGTVTGSTHFLRHVPTGKCIAIDCGKQEQHEGPDNTGMDKLPVSPADVHALFITHAHDDHVGSLREWIAAGFGGAIYCTRATARFLDVLFEFDSPHLDGVANPCYQLGSRIVCHDDEPGYAYGDELPVEGVPGLFYSMLPTSHLVGCVSFKFSAERPVPDGGKQRVSICFSGDIGPVDDQVGYGSLNRQVVRWPKMADALVLESTYGDRPERNPACGLASSRLGALCAAIKAAMALGPNPVVVIPAFTLGRTVDVLADLAVVLLSMRDQAGLTASARPEVTVYSHTSKLKAEAANRAYEEMGGASRRWLSQDSALERLDPSLRASMFAHEASVVTLRHNGCAFDLSWFKRDRSQSELTVFVAGSGTTTNGNAPELIRQYAGDPASVLVLTGYCPAKSPGRQLMAYAGKTRLEKSKLPPLDFRFAGLADSSRAPIPPDEVKMEVHDLSAYYSGHADIAGLVDYALNPAPESLSTDIILVHGENQARLGLKQGLEAGAQSKPGKLNKVYLPTPAAPWYEVDTKRWMYPEVSVLSTFVRSEMPKNLDGRVWDLRRASRRVVEGLSIYGYEPLECAQGSGSFSFALRHNVSTHRVRMQTHGAEQLELRVDSELGRCASNEDVLSGLFPWDSVLQSLYWREKVGYSLLGSPKSIEGVLGEIRSPERNFPIFIIMLGNAGNDLSKLISKRLVAGSGKVYQLSYGNYHLFDEFGIRADLDCGMYFSDDPKEAPVPFYFTQMQDQISDIAASISRATGRLCKIR